jgi:hypothetical protein
MWNKLVAWNNQYYIQISWFLIGMFIAFGINDLGKGDYLSAVIDFGLAVANFIFQDK